MPLIFWYDMIENIEKRYKYKEKAVESMLPQDFAERMKSMLKEDYDAFLKSVAGELVRLVYSAGSMYQQDLSSPYQPFGIIASSVKTAKNMHGTVLALCAKTEFIRACNRIKGQCDAIQKMIKCYMTMA